MAIERFGGPVFQSFQLSIEIEVIALESIICELCRRKFGRQLALEVRDRLGGLLRLDLG